MIEINGSKGGGQMLRTSLTLSAITGESFEIQNIRGSRPNPGLKRQHLEAVKAAARLCNAGVDGLEEGSQQIEFRPGELEPENFTVNIGTAGSVTLLLDTVLPVTTQLDTEFRIDVKGGTDVKWSPTLEYYRQVKLPLLGKFGMDASLELEKTGFYPKGGGEARLETRPYSMQPLELMNRGEIQRFEVYSKASEQLQEPKVAERQADEVERKLKNSHISVPVEKDVDYVDTLSTGSSLVLKAVYQDSVVGFDALGERGKRSEQVAAEVVQDFKSFHSGGAAVDTNMADQLVVFLAIVGGKLSIPEVTNHIQTGIEVVEKFGADIEVERGKERTVLRC